MVKLALETWPIQGRVGLVTSGENEGEYIFVWPEIEGRWGYYTSSGGDDILPDAAWAERWIAHEGQVRWLNPDEDEAVERKIFQLRPITSSEFDWPQPLRSRLSRMVRRALGEHPPSPEEEMRVGSALGTLTIQVEMLERPCSANWTAIDSSKALPQFRWDPSTDIPKSQARDV